MNYTSIIYILLLFSLLICSFIDNLKDNIAVLFFLLISETVLFFTYSGLESDWVTYRYWEEQASALGNSFFEKGFDFLLFIANRTLGFNVVVIVCLFSFAFMIITLRLHTSVRVNSFFIIMISFYLGFLPLYFGALRQAIASNLIYMGLFFLYEKKIKRSLIFFILSFLIHKSSVLILVIYFCFWIYTYVLRNISFSKYSISMTILSIIVYFFLKKVIEFVFSAYGISYMLGNADNFTSNHLKDIFILGERFVFILFDFKLLKLTRNDISKKIFHNFALLNISGSFFFCITYSLARNIAGRTLAFFRYTDIIILYYSLEQFLNYLVFCGRKKLSFEKKMNDISIIICVVYSLIKYYITVRTSGVF